MVANGETHGESTHTARHTARQRVLDEAGDLKLVQKLLGHAPVPTTGDVCVDRDMAEVAARVAKVLTDE